MIHGYYIDDKLQCSKCSYPIKIKSNTEQKKTPEKSDKKSDELSSNLQFDGLSKIVKPNTTTING